MRIKKISLCIVTTLLLAWSSVFITDYVRCMNLETPIFVIPGDNIAEDGGSGTYYGLGYVVEMEKHLDAHYGVILDSVEMSVLGKVISASIQ